MIERIRIPPPLALFDGLQIEPYSYLSCWCMTLIYKVRKDELPHWHRRAPIGLISPSSNSQAATAVPQSVQIAAVFERGSVSIGIATSLFFVFAYEGCSRFPVSRYWLQFGFVTAPIDIQYDHRQYSFYTRCVICGTRARTASAALLPVSWTFSSPLRSASRRFSWETANNTVW